MEASSTVGAPAGLEPDERTDEHPFIASPVRDPTAIRGGQLMQAVGVARRTGRLRGAGRPGPRGRLAAPPDCVITG